jgi:hypothetical protein
MFQTRLHVKVRPRMVSKFTRTFEAAPKHCLPISWPLANYLANQFATHFDVTLKAGSICSTQFEMHLNLKQKYGSYLGCIRVWQTIWEALFGECPGQRVTRHKANHKTEGCNRPTFKNESLLSNQMSPNITGVIKSAL